MSLLDAVRSLTEASSSDEASLAILRSLARTTPANALALLRAGDDGTLVVAAQIGLSVAANSVRFHPADHPRLARATRSPTPIRFADPREPDPYDGLLLGSTAAVDPIHACLAAPLYVRSRLVGVMTMDALDPRGLDGIRDDDVRLFAGLFAAAQRLGPAPAQPFAPTHAARTLLGRSPAIERIEREIGLLASLSTITLVVGETGVGKELVAGALHDRSPRALRPFVAVNCAALPRELVLAELFGHARRVHRRRRDAPWPLRGSRRRDALPRRDRRSAARRAGAAAACAPARRDPARGRGAHSKGRRARRRGHPSQPA